MAAANGWWIGADWARGEFKKMVIWGAKLASFWRSVLKKFINLCYLRYNMDYAYVDVSVVARAQFIGFCAHHRLSSGVLVRLSFGRANAALANPR